MDLDYFFELSDRLDQMEASSVSTDSEFLSENEKEEISKISFDYDIFRYDFDLTCKFLHILCRLEKQKYSKFHMFLLKHIFILSTFLKNKTTTKLCAENQNLLQKVNENLTNILFLKSIMAPPKIYDSCRSFAAFSLVSIHEIVGITKNLPTNHLAAEFFTFEVKTAEERFVSVCSDFSDYLVVAEALDEIVKSSYFSKYNKVKEIKPKFKKKIEKHLIYVFTVYVVLISVVFVIISEFCLSRISSNNS